MTIAFAFWRQNGSRWIPASELACEPKGQDLDFGPSREGDHPSERAWYSIQEKLPKDLFGPRSGIENNDHVLSPNACLGTLG